MRVGTRSKNRPEKFSERSVLGHVLDAFTIENASFRDRIRAVLGPVLDAFTIENAPFRGRIPKSSISNRERRLCRDLYLLVLVVA